MIPFEQLYEVNEVTPDILKKTASNLSVCLCLCVNYWKYHHTIQDYIGVYRLGCGFIYLNSFESMKEPSVD